MSVNTKVNGQLVKSAGLYKASVPIQSGDIYSFEERRIGVWADGKPLYQKTFDLGDIAQSSNAQVDITSLNIESVATILGTGKDASGNIIPIPFAHTVNTTSNVFCRYNSNGNLGVYTGSQSISNDTVVTIQYTKTTDVAGSGEYVPSGDKAVHYSANEEVIGTWIDGSTLYRKTLKNTANVSLSPSAWSTIQWDDEPTNLSYLVSAELHSVVPNTNEQIRFIATSGNIKGASVTSTTFNANTYVTFTYTKSS